MLIALLADDVKTRSELKTLLEPQQYRVSVVPMSDRLPPALRRARPDLLVMAFTVSRTSLEALAGIREDPQLRRLAILCLGHAASEKDCIACLNAGADDFIGRPLNPQIFLARARVLLRRRIKFGDPDAQAGTAIRHDGLCVKLLARQVTVSEQLLDMTRLEFDLLAYLLRHANQTLKREAILEAVWHYSGDIVTRTLDKHIEILRRKLGKHGKLIQTVHGIGYRFSAPALEPSNPE